VENTENDDFCKITEIMGDTIFTINSSGEQILFEKEKDICDLQTSGDSFITCIIENNDIETFFVYIKNNLVRIKAQKGQKIRRNKKESLLMQKDFVQKQMKETSKELKMYEGKIYATEAHLEKLKVWLADIENGLKK